MLKIVSNTTVAGLSAWLSLISGIFSALTKLNPEWFGRLTWPQAILLGIAAALVVAFLASAILLMYGYGTRLIKHQKDGSSEPRENQAKSVSLESRVTVAQNNIAHLLSNMDESRSAIDGLNNQNLSFSEALDEVRNVIDERVSEIALVKANLESLGTLVCIQSALLAAAYYINLMENAATASNWQLDIERVQQQVFAPHLKFCGPDESIGNGMVGNREAPNESLVDPGMLRAYRQRYSDLRFAYKNLENRESILRTIFEQAIA